MFAVNTTAACECCQDRTEDTSSKVFDIIILQPSSCYLLKLRHLATHKDIIEILCRRDIAIIHHLREIRKAPDELELRKRSMAMWRPPQAYATSAYTSAQQDRYHTYLSYPMPSTPRPSQARCSAGSTTRPIPRATARIKLSKMTLDRTCDEPYMPQPLLRIAQPVCALLARFEVVKEFWFARFLSPPGNGRWQRVHRTERD